MRGRVVAVFMGLWLICGVAKGQINVQAVTPASRPSSEPASQPAPLDPAVEKILDRWEKKNVHDIQADIVYVKADKSDIPGMSSEQKYKGILRFIEDKPSPRFFIRFDEQTIDGMTDKNSKQWHVFDGHWYIEAQERTKSIVKREIVRPGDKQAGDLFKIGKGPFPMPFGQKKEDIVRHFTIKLVPPQPGDPPDSDHLVCTPLPGTDMDRRYGKVHFLIDRKLDVPVRVQTLAKEDQQEITATFTSIQLNKGLAGSDLNLPNLPGYEVTEERLDDAGSPPPMK
jgi:hypothetical protein